MRRCVIYARYSSEKQTEQSIEGQLRVCYEYAQRNDLIVVKEYIDRAMTGTNDLRRDFQKMLSDSEKTKTSLRELNNAERSAELARIMGASAADESAQKYASELIESANRFKLSKVNELD